MIKNMYLKNFTLIGNVQVSRNCITRFDTKKANQNQSCKEKDRHQSDFYLKVKIFFLIKKNFIILSNSYFSEKFNEN